MKGRGTCGGWRGEEHVRGEERVGRGACEGERNVWRGEEQVEGERLVISIIGCTAARAFTVLSSLHLSKGLRSSQSLRNPSGHHTMGNTCSG